MKALSLWDPWGTLVAIGAKRYETRSWPTRHRGPLAIHVAASWKPESADAINHPVICATLAKAGINTPWMLDGSPVSARDAKRYFPLGSIIAVIDLLACIRMTDKINPPPAPEVAFGDFTFGRYAWRLADVRRLPEPIPCRGSRGLWDLPDDVEAKIRSQLG